MFARAQLATALDRLDAAGAATIAQRRADLARLAAAAPCRPSRGAIDTADVDGLALFDAVRSPTFL